MRSALARAEARRRVDTIAAKLADALIGAPSLAALKAKKTRELNQSQPDASIPKVVSFPVA